MKAEFWYLLIGVLLVLVALSSSMLKKLPLSTTMLYLGLGVALGPLGFGLFRLDPLSQSGLLERIAEVAVIVSLFTTGLKLRVPLRDKLWRVPVQLAFVSMTLTVGLVALVGVYALGLPLGAAVLLGAVLAPTDPVLASDVQLAGPRDTDRLRFSITGEAGLNDGTAFPFVMLGLGLLGVHEIGAWGWRWLAVDVVWAIAGGLTMGAGAGWLIGKLVLYLRRERKEGFGLDEFLALGLIGLVYGGALLAHTYGFLAVFAAGLALRTLERSHTGEEPPEEIAAMALANKDEEIATHPEKAPAYMAGALLGFNEQLERVLEFGLVLLVGAMLTAPLMRWDELWFVAILFLLIRPAAVLLGCPGGGITWRQRGLISWFGIRGIGSIYYLMFAMQHSLAPEIAARLISVTLGVIAVSVVVHGISVTPLMKWYHRGDRLRAG
ncbi:MAG: sodium:proton antiporter [Chthoniobacterales bacterium]|nr:sodium:proton antiporter [Chthoniobacterales bacterium]